MSRTSSSSFFETFDESKFFARWNQPKVDATFHSSNLLVKIHTNNLDWVGRFVGKKGGNISCLQQKYKCKVSVDREHNQVWISNLTTACAEDCKEYTLKVIDNCLQRSELKNHRQRQNKPTIERDFSTLRQLAGVSP